MKNYVAMQRPAPYSTHMSNTANVTNSTPIHTSRDDADNWLTPEGEATLRAMEDELSRIRIARLVAGE